jgi:hypothetical protein
VRDSVIPVHASLQSQPMLDPTWTWAELADARRRNEAKKDAVRAIRALRAEQRREQLRVEAQINKSFLFIRWQYAQPPTMCEDHFLFRPPPPPRNRWRIWRDLQWVRVVGPNGE